MNLSLDDVARPSSLVAIGGSAGALDALVEFFSALPATTNASYVVLQHLSPNHRSALAKLIADHTEMEVSWLADRDDLRPGKVYVVPPRHSVAMEGSTLRCVPNDSAFQRPVSELFHSVGKQTGRKRVCVLLSGTGTDGSDALTAVQDSGGLVMVQQPSSAQFDGMPSSALRTGTVDYVGAPRELANRLATLLGYTAPPSSAAARDEELEDPLAEVLDVLERSFGVAFAHYKPASVQRRIQRRAAAVRARSLAEYVEHLRASETEVDLLFRDLLITVTSFFRDPEAWEALRRDVLTPLIAGSNAIRIWTAGCATGEEAASLAIAIEELSRLHDTEVDYRIFASDISPTALEQATSWTFDADVIDTLPSEYADRYFDASGLAVRLKEHLRDRILIVPHDLTRDPPLTNLDLVVCRNVLIYFQRGLQRRTIERLSFGLKTGGHLMLGASETLSDDSRVFSTVNARWRLFRKERELVRETPHEPLGSSPTPPRPTALRDFSGVALGRIVLDESGAVLEATGQLSQVLVDAAKGSPILDQTAGTDRAALQQLLGSLATGSREEVTVVAPGRGTLIGRRTTRNGVPHTEVLLHPDLPEDKALALEGSTIERLESEETNSRRKLRWVVDELERSNEKLTSANEELRASNEALQSSNEELQVVNEELLTLNREYQQKTLEVLQVSDDLESFIESAQLATLFVDESRRLRRLTPAMSAILPLASEHIGSPIRDVSHGIPGLDLDELVSCALAGTPRSDHTVSQVGGPTYLVRSLPRMSGGRLEGAAITLFDVTETQAAQVRLTELLEQAHRDHLTGLLNRRGLEAELRKMQSHARRSLQPLFAVLIDCDNFKRINDTFGYSVGDVVLREIASRFEKALRPLDLVARLGGDEFLAVLFSTRGAEAMRVAERCRLSISSLPFYAGQPVDVTVSVGVAEIDPGDKSLEQILRRSEGVVRRSKRRGKNKTTRAGQDTANHQGELAAIAAGDGLWTAAHPLYQLDSEEILGAEFLSRGPGPFQNPRLLFESCESVGLLKELDISCIRRALSCAKPGERAHINVLPSTLLELSIEEIETLFSTDADLCVELSEQQFLGAPSYLMPVVEHLRANNARLAIDDVGFGQSALESLILLEPDVVKIDRAFVTEIDLMPHKRLALGRLVQAVKALDCDVIAEGIETKGELQVLLDLGVEQGQGFYWGEPQRTQPRP